MKKILIIFLLLSVFCCSCVAKQNLPLSELKSESKHIIENAPFCLTSASLIEYTLIIMSGKMNDDIYTTFITKDERCGITDDNLHIEVIESTFGISKIRLKNGAVSITGYTFDEFISSY